MMTKPTRRYVMLAGWKIFDTLNQIIVDELFTYDDVQDKIKFENFMTTFRTLNYEHEVSIVITNEIELL